MTLHGRVADLDDYSGELAQALTKLEIEKERGTLNAEEQSDFIQDLRKAALRKNVSPWRSKGLFAFVAVLVLLGLAAVKPLWASGREPLRAGVLGVACVALVFGVFARIRASANGKREEQWLKGLESTLKGGKSILD